MSAWGMGNRRAWALIEALHAAGLVKFTRGDRRNPSIVEVLSPTQPLQDRDQHSSTDRDQHNNPPETPARAERAAQVAAQLHAQDAAPLTTRAVRPETDTETKTRSPVGEGESPSRATAAPPSDPDPKPVVPRGPRPSGPLSSAWASAWLTEHGAVYAFAPGDRGLLATWGQVVGDDVQLFVACCREFHAEVKAGRAWKNRPMPGLKEFSDSAQTWVNLASAKRATTAAQRVTEAAKARTPQAEAPRPAADPEAAVVWRGVLEHLQGHIGHQDVTIWLERPAVPLSVSSLEIVVSVENAYYREWIVDNYLEHLEDALGTGKGGRALRLVVDAEVQARSREGPATAAAK